MKRAQDYRTCTHLAFGHDPSKDNFGTINDFLLRSGIAHVHCFVNYCTIIIAKEADSIGQKIHSLNRLEAEANNFQREEFERNANDSVSKVRACKLQAQLHECGRSICILQADAKSLNPNDYQEMLAAAEKQVEIIKKQMGQF